MYRAARGSAPSSCLLLLVLLLIHPLPSWYQHSYMRMTCLLSFMTIFLAISLLLILDSKISVGTRVRHKRQRSLETGCMVTVDAAR